MDKIKQYVALTALASLAILAGSYQLLISPKQDEATAVRAQTASMVSANAGLRTQLQVLQAQAKELPKKQADLARVAAKIPDNPALPALIRALTAASISAGVEFVSIIPGQPTAVAAPAAGVVAPVDPAAPAAAAPAPAVPAASATGELASIPVTLNVVGDYFEIEQFLANLENLPRALRVTNLVLAPGAQPTAGGTVAPSTEDGRSLTSTITGTVFLAANRPAATPVVAPVAAPAN